MLALNIKLPRSSVFYRQLITGVQYMHEQIFINNA